MIGAHGVGDLLQDGRLAGSGWGNDKAAGSPADRCHQIDDSGFDQIGRGLEAKLLDWIDRGKVLETKRLGVISEGHPVDRFHRLQLGAISAMRRLKTSSDVTAFPKKTFLDGVRRDEDVGRLGLEMVVFRPKKPKSLLRNFKVTGSHFSGRDAGRVAHNVIVLWLLRERVL